MPSSTEAQQRYLQNRRKRALAYLGEVCVKCGTSEDLQFDHIDPVSKAMDIANAIAKHWSWSRLVVELGKCQLLCGPHHREKSRLENPSVVPHGGGASGKRNCPCGPCRARKAEYTKAYIRPSRRV